MTHKEIIIIGGGISGLSLASYLKDRDYLVLESEDEVGGYCRTIKTENFVWDYSGHFFHFNNEEIKDKLTSNIECEILSVKKISKIFYNNSYIDFPFQYNIHQLEKKEFIDCLKDLFFCEKGKEVNNFKDYVYSNLGESISNKFIIPYNEKLYSCNLDSLDYDCMKRFFPNINFNEFMSGLGGKSFKSYNDNFIYPKEGAFEFIKSILKDIPEDKIKINERVNHIDLKNKILKTNNNSYTFDKLVSTIPFKKLLEINGESTENFNHNKVVVFNIGFDKPSVVDSHWVYYPGDEIFYRVGFYDNIMSTDKMSIYVEIGLPSHEEVNEEILFESVLSDLNKVGLINGHNVLEYKMLVLNPAYVHINKYSNEKYEKWSNEWNPNGIYSIGRYGSWTYCSIEDNVIQSKKISEKI